MSARTDDYCRKLIAVAKTLPLPPDQQKHAAEICWTACGGETTWANYANDGNSTLLKLGQGHGLSDAERAVARRSLNFPHDAVGRNLDSVGILQQRPGAGWGTPEELMDVSNAYRKFFHGAGGNKGLLDHSGWQTDEVWHAAWSVQQCGPSDVFVYKNAAAQAASDIGRLWGDTAAAATAVDTPTHQEDDDMASIYKVVNCDGIDYAVGDGTFIFIRDPDHYHFMNAAGFIDTPHGQGKKVDKDELKRIRDEAVASAVTPKRIDSF